MLLPPSAKDVAPEQLFRGLLTLPRPVVHIARRLYGAEDVPLAVQALSSAEASEADGNATRLVAAALMAAGKRAFSAPEHVERLLGYREIKQLAGDVLEALGRISPTYATSHTERWKDALLVGCRHPSNRLTAFSLGSCAEVVGDTWVDRPERYFGVPPSALIDCHWIAYRAARTRYFEETAS